MEAPLVRLERAEPSRAVPSRAAARGVRVVARDAVQLDEHRAGKQDREEDVKHDEVADEVHRHDEQRADEAVHLTAK